MEHMPGLQYLADYLDEVREQALIEVIDRKPWLTESRRGGAALRLQVGLQGQESHRGGVPGAAG
jgi:hypothetical protein